MSPPARPRRAAAAPVGKRRRRRARRGAGRSEHRGDAPSRQRRVAASYLRLPRDSEKVHALRAELAAFQRAHGLPSGRYEERPENLRLARSGDSSSSEREGARSTAWSCSDSNICLRARATSLGIIRSLGVPVIAANGVTVDPANSFVTWLARGRERQRKRSRRRIEQKQQRGERTGGIRFGYQLDADGVHLVPAPAEQRTISRAVELRQPGMSYRRIAATLNEEGHCARGGARITHGQVSRWIRAREKTGNRIAPQGMFHSIDEQIDRPGARNRQ